jgi:hypothetical protein
VKRCERVVHGDKELVEKVGRNDPCSSGSGKRFQKCWRTHFGPPAPPGDGHGDRPDVRRPLPLQGQQGEDVDFLCHPQQLLDGCLVVSVDRDTGRSTGFGFVEMDGGEQTEAALDALNGQEVNGRALTVNGLLPREERGDSHQQLTPAP